jgi:L-threonylcarbamoyladenylate synthase
MTEEAIDRAAIEKAGQILRAGGLVAFPTETVYGLGGDALNPESSRKIYAAKGRPSDNPLIVHICRMEDLAPIVRDIPDEALRLAEACWPGPLTMIFHKSDLVPPETTGGLDTVAVRFPSNRIAMALIAAAGGYIAAPSANRSGRPSPTLARYCREDLDGRVEMIIDGGPVGIGLESTIIDLTEGQPVILRPGYVTQERLEQILGRVETDRAIIEPDSGTAPKAPGMKYRHYAPKGSLTIVEGGREAVIAYINARTRECREKGIRTGVICTDETCRCYTADSVKSAGARTSGETIASRLFRILREFDDEEIQVMFSESFGEGGLGQAIMNRLMKAAGHKIVHV